MDKSAVDYAVWQAAVWIITDDATYNDLGRLRENRVRMIGKNRAAEAMKICDEAGIDIMKKNIWRDRNRILQAISNSELREWLESKE